MTLQELKELAEKVTHHGVWSFHDVSEPGTHGNRGCQYIEDQYGFSLLCVYWNDDDNIVFASSDSVDLDRVDMEFIAASNPITVLQLIERVEKLSDALQQISHERIVTTITFKGVLIPTMKYNIFDSKGKYLGTIHAANPEEALALFKKDFNEPTADHAVERDVDAHCPCGQVPLRDTEDWPVPLCQQCYVSPGVQS